jgi:hypothetical protein
MFTPADSPTFAQRLTRPRTKHNLAGESTSSRNSPIAPTHDYTEHKRLSYSNDLPLSLGGSISFHHPESPSRSPHGGISNAAPRQSAMVDNSDVDLAAAVALLQELKKRASPEDLVLLHKALLPSKTKRDASPVNEEAKEYQDPISPLIRRCSLLPAGVKTRLSRELLKNFEALNLAAGDTETPAGRRTTPSNVCPQVGTYKRGSLRITNGSASPESSRLIRENTSHQRKTSAPDSSTGDGFVTADEGESSLEFVRPSRATLVSLRAPQRDSEVNAHPDTSVRPNSRDTSVRPKSRGPPTSSARPMSRGTPVRRPSGDNVNKSSPPQPHRHVSHRASEYAQEYTSEFDTLENPHLSDPALTTAVSRLSTVHDESPIDEGVENREEALRRLNGHVSSTNGLKNSQGQTHLNVSRPPIKQSDSGYSSEASRRSIDAADPTERTRAKPSPSGAPARPSLEQIMENRVSSSNSPHVQAQISAMQKAEKHKSMPSFFKKTASTTPGNTIVTSNPTKQTKKLQKPRPQSHTVVTPKVKESGTKEVEPELPNIEPEFTPDESEDLSVNFSRPTRRMEGQPSASPQTKQVERSDVRGRGRSRKQDAKSQPASPEASPAGTTQRRSRSFFRFRGRSRSQGQHRRDEEVILLSVADEPLPTHDFTNFGTVAKTLGHSPYDIAPDTKSAARQKSRDKSVDRSWKSRGHAHESIGTIPSQKPARGKARRTQSAHNSTLPRVPEAVPEVPKQTQRNGDVRVGTIDFGTGVAQGRLEPILTETEKAQAKRRTQSVGPRVRQMMTDESMPTSRSVQASKVPKVPSREAPKASHHAAQQKALNRERPRLPALQSTQASPPRVPSQGKGPVNLNRPLSTAATTVKRKPVSALHTPASSTWESQALAWRERKQTIGELLYSPDHERRSFAHSQGAASSQIQAYSPPRQAHHRAPAVIVSRYVTPQGSEFAMHLGQDPYRRLHSENHTDLRPAQEDVARTDSSSTYRTATSERSQDSFASRDSAKYRAYRAVENAAVYDHQQPPQPTATFSSSAIPNGNISPRRSSRHYTQQHQQLQQQQQQQLKRRPTAPQPETPNQTVAYDRFSGGLGYGWERGIGINGSAGTRQKNDIKASRKSVTISQNFGVDLSDVPVFMVKN